MTTGQQPPVFTPEDVRKNFERIQTDLNVVQNELDQALGVWRAILDGEKKEFAKLLEDREKDWDKDEQLWQRDQQAYRQKIDELETYFKNQLTVTEKNAVRALNELDAAWQQERLRWQETVAQQTTEFRQTSELQTVSQQQLELRLAQLLEENTQLRSHLEQIAPMETAMTEWQAEKAAWQQSLSDHLDQHRQAEENWALERQDKELAIQSLQEQLAEAQQHLQQTDQSQTKQEDHVHVFMNTLETQVTALQDFVNQMFQPRRRKSDATFQPPSQFRPSSDRAGY